MVKIKLKLTFIYDANNTFLNSENRREFCHTENEKQNGGKAIKTGLCKRVSAKPVFAAPLSSQQTVRSCWFSGWFARFGLVCALKSAPEREARGWRGGVAAPPAVSRRLLLPKRTHYNHLTFLTIKIYRFLCRILREKNWQLYSSFKNG